MAFKDNPKLVIAVLAIVILCVLGILLMQGSGEGESRHQERTREAAEAALEALEGDAR